MILKKKTWTSTLFSKTKNQTFTKNSPIMSLTKAFRKFLKKQTEKLLEKNKQVVFEKTKFSTRKREKKRQTVIQFFFSFYRVFLQPQIGYSCKFHPTCSCYVKESFETLEPAKAVFFSLKRLIRCHPFSSGGFDPVPKKQKNGNQKNKNG